MERLEGDQSIALVTADDHDLERASNSYLMSLLAIMIGMPLPIVNLIATFIFFLGNRKAGYFVRWHCTQALLSQLTVLIINSYGLSWTLRIIFTDLQISNAYVAYMITMVLFNLSEIIATGYAAIRIRKGRHVSFWFFGNLTDLLCRK